MVTVSVTLDDAVYDDLKRKADEMGEPVEALVAAIVSRESASVSGATAAFLADVREMIDAYRPVLRKLA